MLIQDNQTRIDGWPKTEVETVMPDAVSLL